MPSLRIMPEGKTTVLCPSCKNRMSIRKIAQAMSEDAREINYHCAMCDIEIRRADQSALLAAGLIPAAFQAIIAKESCIA